MTAANTEGHHLFWALAAPWLEREGVDKSTMMGHACLRTDGRFFASVNRDGTALIVKLCKVRVRTLVEAGGGEEFAPNGRVFREWVAVPLGLAESWSDRIAEAYAFVAEGP